MALGSPCRQQGALEVLGTWRSLLGLSGTGQPSPLSWCSLEHLPGFSGAGEVQRSVESLQRVKCVCHAKFCSQSKTENFFCGKKLTGTDEVPFHGLFKQYKMLLMLSFFHVIWESMSDYVN